VIFGFGFLDFFDDSEGLFELFFCAVHYVVADDENLRGVGGRKEEIRVFETGRYLLDGQIY
jgi:hypothetical protein